MTTRPGTLLFAAMVALTLLVASCNKPVEPSASAPAPAPAGSQVNDMDVTTNVKTALQQDAALKGYDIQVLTLKGDVRLVGVLSNQTQIDDAIKLARSADGVHSIHDELTLKK